MNWLGLIPYLLAFAIGVGTTYPIARAPLQGSIADLRMENAGLREAGAESARLAALAASAKLSEAQASGERLSQKLAVAMARNDQLTEEKKHALKDATDGRACLSARALRVLNGATGITVADGGAGVPQATGQPAATGEPVATDSDIGGWILDAGKRHEACREQLGALIDWVNTNSPIQEPPRGPNK